MPFEKHVFLIKLMSFQCLLLKGSRKGYMFFLNLRRASIRNLRLKIAEKIRNYKETSQIEIQKDLKEKKEII